MTPEEVKSLRKIAKELNDIIENAERGEDRTDTPIVITAPQGVIDGKAELLAEDKE
jgi:hypothetical protein